MASNCLSLLFLFTLMSSSQGQRKPSLAEGKNKPNRDARCSLFGEYHIQTFDGNFYEFPGHCSYKLAGDCLKRSFSLLGNFQDGKRTSISLYLGEYFEVTLSLKGEASVRKKRVLLPFASHGVFIGTESGFYIISSDEHGFTVRIDTSGSVAIMLSKKYASRTCGLCGDYNNFPQDDYISQEGFLVVNSYDFANSWAMHDVGELCNRVSAPSKTCNMSSEAVQNNIMQKCKTLKTSKVFQKCHDHLDPEPFIAICEDDTCHCAGRNCHCQAFMEYARSCALKGVLLNDWFTANDCKLKCPSGMEYGVCVPACEQTCRSLNINQLCHEQCMDGCTCGDGRLLDGDTCVASSECSCMHMGKQYPPGSSISQDCHTCICSHGKWECTNEECPGECFVIGQSHFKSFDDKYFTFIGMCQYLLAKDCEENTFAAFIEKVQCADDPDAVCIRSVTLKFQELGNMTIKLKHGGRVSVNGMDIQPPLIQGPLRIQHTVLSSVRVIYDDDFQFDWDGYGKVYLKLSAIYTGTTCGLCGNFNGNQGDDFLTPSGLVETEMVNFGNSWKVNGGCADLEQIYADPCNLNPKRVTYAEEVCSVLLLTEFEPCHHEVNPMPFLKICQYDVCACSNGNECLCSAVSSYAEMCAKKGVLINWRTPEFCEMTCPDGQIYKQCGTPCNQTCRSLSNPDLDCTEFCLEGCYCPPDQYANEDGNCVPKSECFCYFNDEIYKPHEDITFDYTICYCENGVMHCSANGLAHHYPPSIFLDTGEVGRAKRETSCDPPMTKFSCPEDDPTAQGTECLKTCQNYDLDCVSSKCTSGCMCPHGQVQEVNTCISPEMCPCLHNGKSYVPGETIKQDCNTCKCLNRKWHCTNKVCAGTCIGVGESHYITFDGLKYTFPGKCQYVLVQDSCGGTEGTFRIIVEHSGCGLPGEDCSKDITVFYEGGELVLYGKEVTIKNPIKNEADMQIFKSGLYYIIMLGKKITVLWDKGTRISVQLQGQYKGKVCGLCGNFDGNANNDLVGSGNQLEIEPIDFGNSWTVKHLCADAYQTPSPCSGNSLKQTLVENSCDIIKSGLFSECAQLIDPEPFWEICVYDTCSCDSTGECLCLCNAIAAYAHECANLGVFVQWRTANLCPISCEELNTGQAEYVCEWRYNVCAPACPRTCQHQLEEEDCPVNCVEGCHAYCPSGTILDESSQKCIDPALCPVCIYENQRILDGQTIIINKGTEHCQTCSCTGTSLHCQDCPAVTTEPTLILPSEAPEIIPGGCHRVMELAFLIDGSMSFSKQEFEEVKKFVLAMMEQMQIGQSNIRVSVLQFHSRINKLFDLWEKKSVRELKTLVRTMQYIGGSKSNLVEALKHTAVLVFGKDARKKVPRIAILVTASTSSNGVGRVLPFIIKRKVTVITVGIGSHINPKEIGLITSKSRDGKSFILKNVNELKEYRRTILDYVCSRGATPPPPTTMGTALAKTTASATTSPSVAHVVITTTSQNKGEKWDVVFLVEDSDKVGEDNFNRTKEFMIKTVEKFQVKEGTTHVSVVQYSDKINDEFTFISSQKNWEVIERIKQMRYHGGEHTNTGNALMHVIEETLTMQNGAREEAPDLVFMITSNPPSDSITNPIKTVKDRDVDLIPIVIGPDIDIAEFPLPVVQTTYENITNIVDTVYETCCQPTIGKTVPTTLTTATTLLPSVPCTEPMDVAILLDGSDNVGETQFEEMKTFVKTFVGKIQTGTDATHISVLQYGRTNTQEISFDENQEKENLLDLIDQIQQREPGPSQLGSALSFTIQNMVMEAKGARVGMPKIVVVIVTDTSKDDVGRAAQEAVITGVTVIPIGIGQKLDERELLTVAGHNPNHVLHLGKMDALPIMMTLSDEFIEKVCTATSPQECIDDEGNRRQAGDKWMLADNCHSFECKANGEVLSTNHKINCDKLRKPTCSNNLPSVKIEEKCGCRYACPCVCTVTAKTQFSTFDGHWFSLTGKCSYLLLEVDNQETKIIIHKGPCHSNSNENCIKAIEIKQNNIATLLHDDMTVSVNGKFVSLPLTVVNMDVIDHGSSSFVANIPDLGIVLVYSPLNNLFSLWVSPTLFLARVSGLCGKCDNNPFNDFELQDGSIVNNSLTFIKDWTLKESLSKSCIEEVLEAPLECKLTGDECSILHSAIFDECRNVVDVQPYLRLCKQKACNKSDTCDSISAYSFQCKLMGVCVKWRSNDFCSIQCPNSLAYEPCGINCIQHCDSIMRKNSTHCLTSPTEGCFCPEGKVLLEGKCVTPDICSQCIDDQQVPHQHLDTWIPHDQPCQLCMCLDNRQINCTNRPCPTVTAPKCGPCEKPALRRNIDECCPQYVCDCDLLSCDLPITPTCEDGSYLSLKNPGECKPIYECVCDRSQCEDKPISCPSHRALTVVKTQCCDKYECACSCSNEIVSCPAGYSVKSVINDCNCTTSYCEPNEVCVHNGVVYLTGKIWEESCQKCSCTDRKNTVTGLHEVECVPKTCNKNCPTGQTYRDMEGSCCGKCKRTVCEVDVFSRGDANPQKIVYQAGEQWPSPDNPCITLECLELNGEVIVHEKNKSCTHIDVPTCPLGYELKCNRVINCCPMCQCVAGNVCVLNGTSVGAGDTLKIDDCTDCRCSKEADRLTNTHSLQCVTKRCRNCPDGYTMKKEKGSCCGICQATRCIIHLANGTVVMLKADESIQDDCDSFRCKVNENGEISTEKRTVQCTPFDKEECKAGGGEIVRVDSSCCFSCKYKSQQCKKITGIIKHIRIDDCVIEGEVNMHYCEGRCPSKSAYSLQKDGVQNECTCCSATASTPLLVPLRCLNGTVLQHKVIDMQECACVAHKCE
ncbi:von Willebrand factor isoform X1 [Stegostoma tigrinum]|uniref:von Willebrand factor isoform X1 n=1 Tax=Stegostoma tigrinum TaxID=3053191 RepID=UPI0028702F5D|nr:von Willebrand factor isoform X1 [Stegostoma tigrinum]